MNWIAVKDRCPDKAGEYLTYSEAGYHVRYYSPGSPYWTNFWAFYVKYWMPLPPVPKKE